MGEEQKPLVGQMRPQVPVEAPEEDEWEDPEPVWGPYDREARRAVRGGRALRAVEGDYAEAEMRAVASAGLSDDIAACRDEQARNEVIVVVKAADMSPAEWFAASLGELARVPPEGSVVRQPVPSLEEVALDAYMAALDDLAPDNGGAARLFSPAVAREDRGDRGHGGDGGDGWDRGDGGDHALPHAAPKQPVGGTPPWTRKGNGIVPGTVARLSEPEVYPSAGYTGLTAAQAAALRGAWEGGASAPAKLVALLSKMSAAERAELTERLCAPVKPLGGEDGHVFKLSDAANAHMKRVGAVYTACRWAAEQAPPLSAHAGGQPRDWTPGARFRLTPAPLGEAGEEVGVTLICVVPGVDIHRAQVVFRADNAPAPRALLIGLWRLTTRPEGA